MNQSLAKKKKEKMKPNFDKKYRDFLILKYTLILIQI